VAKLDGVTASNIAKVNGLVFSSAPAFSGLLDTYTGAAAAYSTRRLNGQYTGAAMRVREDSGDTETDIGFDASGNLLTADIATHCGSANGYVTKWYDQAATGGTGSGNDAAQTTNAFQPKIYDGSAVITDANSNVAMLTQKNLDATGFKHLDYTSSTANDPLFVMTMSHATGRAEVFSVNNYTTFEVGWNNASAAKMFIGDGSTYSGSYPSISAVPQVLTFMKINDAAKIYSGTTQKGSTDTSDLDNTESTIKIGAWRNAGALWLSEVLVYKQSNQESSLSGMVTDLESYYTTG